MRHPTIVTFGRTVEGKFPLILVIGREPNFNGDIEDGIGCFALDYNPRCCFWNRSLAQFARIGGKSDSQAFKVLCKTKNACPIIYADSLGIGILFKDSERDKRRKEWVNQEGKVSDHIGKVFEKDVINRVALVVLSGLKEPVFVPAVEAIEASCLAKGKPFEHTSFYGSRRTNAELDRPLLPKLKLLSRIYADFTGS